MSRRRAAAAALSAPLVLVLLATSAGAQGVQLDTAGPGTVVGLWVARLLNHLSLAATVGLLLVPAWLLTGRVGTAGRRASRLAAATAVVWALSAVAVLLFGVSHAVAQPLPQALQGGVLERFLDTRFGAAVAVQAAAALAVALVAASSRDARGARAALGGALLGALAPAVWGHAGTADPAAVAVLADWVHIGAASLWVGGLLAVTVVVLGSLHADPHGPTARFSRLAGWAILAVGGTGVVNTVLHTGGVDQLVTTQWGRLALGKALLLVGLAGFGWAHRRRTVPRLEAAGDRQARRLFTGIAAAELVVMLGAFGLATTMASGMPAEVEASARIQTVRTALGDGLVEMTLDPAATGRNELHLYVFEADGRTLREVGDAQLVFRSADVPNAVTPPLVRSGTGHLLGFPELPGAGAWTLELEVVVEGQRERATATLHVR